MRIQHNLSAMNSLSNYNGNNSKLSSNLEKLSSGYSINSAADNAAGLAISEKMRSQIAGLEKAQDNANDGISLIQTAEGALTEVNSMLTRLTELATQSANGTYEDGVDRANIQEETDAILSEMDRISQSTNFNGINLLDGSLGGATISKAAGSSAVDTSQKLDASFSIEAGTAYSLQIGDTTFGINSASATNAASVIVSEGTGSVKETTDKQGNVNYEITAGEGDTAQKINLSFSKDGAKVSISQDEASNLDLDQIKLSSPGKTVSLSATSKTAGADATTGSVASASFSVNSKTDSISYQGKNYTLDTTNSKILDDEGNELKSVTATDNLGNTMSFSVDLTGNALKFTADNTDVAFDMTYLSNDVKVNRNAPDSGQTQGDASTAATATYSTGDGDTFVVNNKTYTIMEDHIYDSDGNDLGQSITENLYATSSDTSNKSSYTFSTTAAGKLTVTAGATGVTDADNITKQVTMNHALDEGTSDGTATKGAVAASVTYNLSDVIGENETVSFMFDADGSGTGTASEININADGSITDNLGQDMTTALSSAGLKVDYDADNKTVTFTSITAGAGNDADNLDVTDNSANLAYIGAHITSISEKNSSKVSADEGSVGGKLGAVNSATSGTATIKLGAQAKAGDTITIGKGDNAATFEYVKEGADASEGNIAVTIGADAAETAANLATAIGDNAKAASDATVDGTTVTVYAADNADGSTNTEAVEVSQSAEGLKLQVGDTNDDYQKVSVSVQDMSSEGLGLKGLDLSSQETAGAAIDTIKNAVNTVSMQRGKLGALQNRLDHTLNNLDATDQNITAAESQIRDVDMAKEMTEYSKNNILVQAAQSMLAQANSMPQGVLQLLG